MTGWQPLSVRRGQRQSDGLYEGVPDHLRLGLEEWLRARFGWHNSGGMDNAFMAQIASALRIPATRTHNIGGISDQIFIALNADDGLYLDCLDACLHLSTSPNASGLRATLEAGGSAWTINGNGDGLERRVDATTREAFSRAVLPADAASQELAEAWSAAYGRHPDPSDAWDHAIKAVEELLIPLVVPSQTKANLGHVAGEIKANAAKWKFGLPASNVRSNGETLEGLIRHIWPNPDRHGGTSKRSPLQNEAEGAVQVAITIVELCRGRLVKVP